MKIALFQQETGECFGPGAFMNNNGECTCDGDAFSIISENEPGSCVCDDTFVLSFLDNKCYKCDISQQLVARFDHENDECLCVAFAEFNEDDGVCSCIEGFLNYNGKTCISCSGVGATLTASGICTCGVNAMLDLVDGQLECICKPGYLKSESDFEQCYLCTNGSFKLQNFDWFERRQLCAANSQAPKLILS